MSDAIHLPFDNLNPYQSMLVDGLARTGVSCAGAPWTWRLAELIERESAGVLHFHWTHQWAQGTPLWKFPLALAKFRHDLVVFKRRGGRVVWTVHNLHGHERVNLWRERMISLTLASRADVLIAHTHAAADLIKREFPVRADRLRVIPHGDYSDWYPNTINKASARELLKLDQDAPVVLFFGAVRRYKGVTELIRSFRRVDNKQAILVIAGRPRDAEYEQEIRAAARGDERVRFHLGFVHDDQVQVFLNAADAVVFPYQDMLTSGAMVLAMSFGKASVIPDIPMMKEVAAETAVVYDGTSQGLTQALAHVGARREELGLMGRAARDRAVEWSWQRIGSMVAACYELSPRARK